MTYFPALRLRRLRQNPILQTLVRETKIDLNDLVLPLFIKGERGEKNAISSMLGHYQIPLEKLPFEMEEIQTLGIKSVLLFGIPAKKDPYGLDSYCDNGIIQRAIKEIRKVSNTLIMADTCFCEYTDHGHCGFLNEKGFLDNDKTLELLSKQALSQARAGADVIAPSGMIDGMVKAIRTTLDGEGFSHIPILSYSVKYNSSFYGPFRAAAEGAPSFGDRSSHQMDPANACEAIREATLDVQEGSDMLMVKPAHSFLDVIYRVKSQFPAVPLGAYHTSGEFAMIKAAAQNGWLDEKRAVLEILGGIKRAGADFIITYYAKEFARWKCCL